MAASACGVAVSAPLPWLGGLPWPALPATALAAGGAVSLLALIERGRGDKRLSRLGEMAAGVDQIMIGAAETSYFTDSIEKNVERDLETTQDIAGRATHLAGSRREIAAIDNLQKRARQIHAITDFINQTAFQTNLLALNAAVEAPAPANMDGASP